MTAPIFPDSDARRLKQDILARESVSRGNRPLDWRQPVLQYPFTDRDTSTYGPAVYSRDSEGFVWMSGCVMWTAAPALNQVVTVLPVGFRPMVQAPLPPPLLTVTTTLIVPPSTLLFVCPSTQAPVQLLIDSTGQISYNAAYAHTTAVSDPPRATLHDAAATTVAVQPSYTTLTCGTVDADRDAMTLTANVITIKTAGTYLLEARVGFNVVHDHFIRFTKNGTEIAYRRGDGQQQLQLTHLADLVVGDVIALQGSSAVGAETAAPQLFSANWLNGTSAASPTSGDWISLNPIRFYAGPA